jgi:hypothetical protein
MPNHKLRLGGERYDTDGQMSFEEIGKALGISKGLAWVTYARAIHKLRKKKGAMRMLRELARAKTESG